MLSLKLFWWTLVLPSICLAYIPVNTKTLGARTERGNGTITWDPDSLLVNGERLMIFSGEFHPFRLPVPGLWFDVFQKIKAAGFTAASFYVDWALLEGKPGHVRMDGVFDLEPFFNAASEAGIYCIARPGPYINAEVSGGGFPGWLQRVKGQLRSTDADYFDATDNYIKEISRVVHKYEISRGGPVILLQPENEYMLCADYTMTCFDKNYMAAVENQYRKYGVELPFVSNDISPIGDLAPGTGVGSVDIYGFDYYPFGWGPLCEDPSSWNRSRTVFPTYDVNYTLHNQQSPSSPLAIAEFQGGSSDPWGGVGNENCAALTNQEFERVFYKSLYSMGTKIFNIYMTYGGTNWGNLGHPLGYTSYDIGAVITEDRRVIREKYSEVKLQATFLRLSTAYLTGQPQNGTFGVFTDTKDLATAPVVNHGTGTGFYVVRHSEFRSTAITPYTLLVPTSIGNLSIPQLDGQLTLHGRDSKIHVTNYDLGGTDLIYSSAEVFAWVNSGNRTTLILYGGSDETHEFAVTSQLGLPSVVEGDTKEIITKRIGEATVVNWRVSSSRRIIRFGNNLHVHLLWRNEAYNYWLLDSTSASLATSPKQRTIVYGGYLIRQVSASDGTVHIFGDVNTTTTIEVVAGAPAGSTSISFNGKKLDTVVNPDGRLSAIVEYEKPDIGTLDFATLDWKYIDSLPETQTYDDTNWTQCTLLTSNNPRNLTTPTSLYAGDYGYHAGSLIYRGHFIANGDETQLELGTQGGAGFGHSVHLNSIFLGSWSGSGGVAAYNQTFKLLQLYQGRKYVLTVVMDHMGLDENFEINGDGMKAPRGILDYNLTGHPESSDISWAITGNLGGEDYRDLSRGPLNEGGFFAERQGYHLPGAPSQDWETLSPINQGLKRAGVGFFTTTFSLDVPAGWDVPMSLVFKNETTSGSRCKVRSYRVQIFVNGWQFGKYVNNVGPQTSFPIPEGILNHNGVNYVAVTLWAQDASGAKINGLMLEPTGYFMSSYRKPARAPGMEWNRRVGAY